MLEIGNLPSSSPTMFQKGLAKFCNMNPKGSICKDLDAVTPLGRGFPTCHNLDRIHGGRRAHTTATRRWGQPLRSWESSFYSKLQTLQPPDILAAELAAAMWLHSRFLTTIALFPLIPCLGPPAGPLLTPITHCPPPCPMAITRLWPVHPNKAETLRNLLKSHLATVAW